MKNLKSTTLFLWVLVLGTLIAVLSMTICTHSSKPAVPEPSDTRSYYERFEDDLKNNVHIVDTTDVCAEALEEIYRDDENIYYLPCIKSANITIKLADGNEYPLRVALENELVTIAELRTLGLSMYIEPLDAKNTEITYIEIDK